MNNIELPTAMPAALGMRGGDAAAIDKAFRQSGLFREKWDERHYASGRTYGKETV